MVLTRNRLRRANHTDRVADGELVMINGVICVGRNGRVAPAGPLVPPEAFGATGVAADDQQSALEDALAYAADIRGTVVLSQKYGFSDELTVPSFVNVLGVGGAGSSTASSYGSGALVALHADARLVFDGRGGLSGNFVLNGNNLADSDAFVEFGGVQRTWLQIDVTDTAGNAAILPGTQNSTFIGVNLTRIGGDALVIDYAAASNHLMRTEIRNVSGYEIITRETDAGAGKNFNNLFTRGLFENDWESTGHLYHAGGSETEFASCTFYSLYETTVTGHMLQIIDGTCQFSGRTKMQASTAAGGAIIEDGYAIFDGTVYANNCTTDFTHNGGQFWLARLIHGGGGTRFAGSVNKPLTLSTGKPAFYTAQSATTSVGSVAGKIEVFDASGVSLGFVPIYDAIT